MAILTVNAKGTSDMVAYDVCGCDSWRDHWRLHSDSRRTTCMTIGCNNQVQVGAHVHEHGRRKMWIIGLCRGCNNTREPFPVDERSGWVPATYKPGCGCLATLDEGDTVYENLDSDERLILVEYLSSPYPDTQRWLVESEDTGEQRRVTLRGRKVRMAD